MAQSVESSSAMLERILVIAACAALGACTQTYHPEYHPVTVTTVHSTTPVVVQNPQLANPDEFFQEK